MNIIEMGLKAGLCDEKGRNDNSIIIEDHLARFAALVAAQEREECAKLAETTVCDIHLPTGTKIYGSRVTVAIRARGNT